jgi:hypothetical protein
MKHNTPPPIPQLPVTEAALCRWLGAAAPGDTIVYHRGALARQLCPLVGGLAPEQRTTLARLASRAWKLAAAGLADLVQRRHGFEDFEYLIVARRRPLSARSKAGFALADILAREAA